MFLLRQSSLDLTEYRLPSNLKELLRQAGIYVGLRFMLKWDWWSSSGIKFHLASDHKLGNEYGPEGLFSETIQRKADYSKVVIRYFKMKIIQGKDD